MQISITEAYWTKEESKSDDGTEKGKRTKREIHALDLYSFNSY